MSLEYGFMLKRKDETDIKKAALLKWYPTSMSRELVLEVVPYGTEEEYRIFTEDEIKTVIEYAEDKISELEKFIEDNKKQNEQYKEMLPKAVDAQIYYRIEESITNALINIEDSEKGIKKYQGLASDFFFLLNIFDSNKENYDILCYCG